MKKVMTRAWEIARRAALKFGGAAKAFFSHSLRLAWIEIKNEFAAERVVVVNNKDIKVKTMIGEKNGKQVTQTWTPANKTEFNSALSYLLRGKGYAVVAYYEIVGGVKSFVGIQTY